MPKNLLTKILSATLAASLLISINSPMAYAQHLEWSFKSLADYNERFNKQDRPSLKDAHLLEPILLASEVVLVVYGVAIGIVKTGEGIKTLSRRGEPLLRNFPRERNHFWMQKDNLYKAYFENTPTNFGNSQLFKETAQKLGARLDKEAYLKLAADDAMSQAARVLNDYYTYYPTTHGTRFNYALQQKLFTNGGRVRIPDAPQFNLEKLLAGDAAEWRMYEYGDRIAARWKGKPMAASKASQRLIKFFTSKSALATVGIVAILAGATNKAMAEEISKIAENPEIAFKMDVTDPEKGAYHAQVFNAIDGLKDSSLRDMLVNNFEAAHYLAQELGQESGAAFKDSLVEDIKAEMKIINQGKMPKLGKSAGFAGAR